MDQEPDLSELRQRIETVGERFGEASEDSRRRGERLADLLDEVESSFVRDRLELDRLRQALAAAHEEKAQIVALLQKLLAVTEHANGLGERAALYDLEARVDRLYDQTVSPNGAGASGPGQPEAAARNGGRTGKGAQRAAPAEAGPQEKKSEEPRWETIPDEDDEIEAGHPLDLTSMLGEAGAREDLRHTASRAVLAESTAVQDIFKRVSMITGRLRET